MNCWQLLSEIMCLYTKYETQNRMFYGLAFMRGWLEEGGCLYYDVKMPVIELINIIYQ